MKKNWKNFKEHELVCSCCGKFNPNQEFQTLMDAVQRLRDEVGFPIGVTSAYRCVNHSIEAKKIAKGRPAGQHTIAAIDLKVDRAKAHEVLRIAMIMGFNGIGVNQKGTGRFIHLDIRKNPTTWSY